MARAQSHQRFITRATSVRKFVSDAVMFWALSRFDSILYPEPLPSNIILNKFFSTLRCFLLPLSLPSFFFVFSVSRGLLLKLKKVDATGDRRGMIDASTAVQASSREVEAEGVEWRGEQGMDGERDM